VTSGPTPGTPADDVPQADQESVARAILLRQLTMGPRTEVQLRQAMARRNVPDDVADRLIARFVDVGLIDDVGFAAEFVQSQAAAGGLSRRRVQHKLREKGVPADIVAAAVEQIDTADERAAALDLARRRAARMSGLDPQTKRRRLAGVLARRGYPSEIVFAAVAEALAEDRVDLG
jgi:regulatory protein